MNIENCKYNNVELAARFCEMAEKFLEVIKTTDAQVDMSVPVVQSYRHSCKTVACHGGYCALLLIENFDQQKHRYEDGRNALAYHLGFQDFYDLIDWAGDNPSVWGNSHGWDMFKAFGHQAFGVSNPFGMHLSDIATHYMGVAERLLALQ